MTESLKKCLITVSFDINNMSDASNFLINLCNDIKYHKTILITYDIINL